MKVIFGNMEFGSWDSSPICIIRTVQAVMDLPGEEAADELLTQYDSYVIPNLTECEILYAPGAWLAITKKGESK